ncbi:TIGR04255 family protein [Bradyrhizobium sp.]|uniref:TIGR04255 family protein n=1 Tax=Bradyrhizobium sp. TaxID=376 RepID=UPI00263857A3|nr:TIGR04255 family protein [Bradyrhizobium sp.]
MQNASREPSQVLETFENAPLIYNLGSIQFPKLPHGVIESVADAFHARIRERYPIREDVEAPTITADFNSDGFKFSQQVTTLRQFAAPDKRWAFILTDDMLALHTDTHEQHMEFVERFVGGARALRDIEQAAIGWIGYIGVRYVNLVVPGEREGLQEYFRGWAFPSEQPTLYDGTSVPVNQSMYVMSSRSKVGELRYQALRNPPSTIPPELVTPLVGGNGWSRPVPARDFAVVDLEHSCRFEPLQPFDLEKIGSCIEGLCGFVSDWFLGGASDHAIKVWRGR